MPTRCARAAALLIRGLLHIGMVAVLLAATLPDGESNRIRLTATSGAVFDDFLGSAGGPPNSEYWSAAPGPTAGAGGLETSTMDPANIYLDGQGHLVIQALSTPAGFTSGRLVTFGKVDMLYGRVEARIKLPGGYAIWPAFWMLGTNFFNVGWPECGEIDIVDMVTDATNTSHFYAGLHGPKSPPDTTDFALTAPAPAGLSLTDDFHTYWTDWRPDHIQFGIDSTVLGEFTPQTLPPGAKWVFNAPMYAILNIAVGNAYVGAPDERTPFPATMLVDWFRYTPM